MDNGSGETVQDAQRGQNRQAEPGGEYFVYFWTGRGGGGGGAAGGGGGWVFFFFFWLRCWFFLWGDKYKWYI
ncbi:hypothetical protein FAT99_27030, partial [Klebsiella pneumoniae]